MGPYRTFRLHWNRGRAAGGRRVMHHRIAGPLLLLLTLLVVPEAWGATLYVAKSGKDNPACTQAKPCLTIQHAVNAAVAGDTISIGKGKFGETYGVVINKNLTIHGAGIFSTRVGQTWGYSVFSVAGATVTITKLDVMYGNANTGGGIYNSGNLTLEYVRIWHNSAENGGGGIYNSQYGTISIHKTEIAHNDAGYGGGLSNMGVAELDDVRIVANQGGGIEHELVWIGNLLPVSSLIVTGSEIAGNDGVGVENDGGTISLTNTTVSNNTIAGIDTFNAGITELTHATVADNGGAQNCGYCGGLVAAAGSSIELINTIVANNVPVQCNVPTSVYVNAIGSLISDHTCGNWLTGSNLVGFDPLLGPLKANGGDTHTHALKKGSPAIDAASSDYCQPVDQRGVLRPIDGNGDGVAKCDIGAYEYDPVKKADQ